MAEAVFIRLLEAEDKAAALEGAVRGEERTFVRDPGEFGRVPGAPFAYWVRGAVLGLFGRLPSAECSERALRRGIGTNDDFRFLRLSWEVAPKNGGWVLHAKGGTYSPFFNDLHLVVSWEGAGGELRAFFEAGGDHPSRYIRSESLYFRPGLTWPLRTNGLSFRVMPTGCIFGSKGPAAFVEGDDPQALLALCAVVNSAPFGALVALQLARTELAQSYEVGLIQQTPVPTLTPADESALAALARRAWSLKRSLDTVTETSHAFVLPALLQVRGDSLAAGAAAWSRRVTETEADLARIQAEIDDRCFHLYGITDEDRRSIEQGFGASAASEEEGADPDAEEPGGEEPAEAPAADAASLAAALVSWALGVAFGLFDLCLATGERQPPPAPDPFAPLPPCSPGMLTGEDGLPLVAPPPGYPVVFPADGILVDDPGHDRDFVAAIRRVFDFVFGGASEERLAEAAHLLDPSGDLRGYLRREFFPLHVQRYSKSRRKAPIYWRLGPASGSFSVWLYLHRMNTDTLYRVLRDHAEPRVHYEERRLADLAAEAGEHPSTAQRREIAAQEALVDELRAFRDEVARVAPLWDPDLDDGVILNAAPLYRLFAHTRSWQGECEAAWKKLCAGEYDWSHLALRLWPERVVPKCVDDRSLAIAHGLENALWEQIDGKWRSRGGTEAVVLSAIQARTSSAIQAALRSLDEAPASAKTSSRPRKTVTPAPRYVPAAPAGPVQMGLPLPSAPPPDEDALDALRSALRRYPDGAGKADLIEASGLDEGTWKRGIDALMEAGEVERRGQKRGTKYLIKEKP